MSGARDQRGPGGRSDAGFSLIEVLFSSVVVLAIAVSSVPMFTRGMVSNTAGMDATEVSNEARTHLERLLELPFDSDELVVADGPELQVSEYYSTDDLDWHPFPMPSDVTSVRWSRSTTVRQYGVAALADGSLDIAEALDAGAEPQSVHLKQIEVTVVQTGAFFAGPAKRITLRTLKVK